MSRTVAINPPSTSCTRIIAWLREGHDTQRLQNARTASTVRSDTSAQRRQSLSLSPKGYSRTVLIEGQTVAIRGATFESVGDMASKATGGGLISANTHGPTKFITPGSMNVRSRKKRPPARRTDAQ